MASQEAEVSGCSPTSAAEFTSAKEEQLYLPISSDQDSTQGIEDIRQASTVTLDDFNSDLHLVIDPDGYGASVRTKPPAFSYTFAGARSTHGACNGKIYYEIQVQEHLPAKFCVGHTEKNPHVIRLGWSCDSASFQLGEDSWSYGYDSTGHFSSNNCFTDYSFPFTKGDIIGSLLDLDSWPATLSFMKNGSFLGVAASLDEIKLGVKEMALFPHILSKNCRFKVNFGQMEAWHPPPEGFKYIMQLPLTERVRGMIPPARKSDCEVIMIIGLPGSGKTTFALNKEKNFPEKRYNIIGTQALLNKMTVTGLPRKLHFNGNWRVLTEEITKCVNKLFSIAVEKKRNYIFDKCNISAQSRKLKMRKFAGFLRKAAVIQPDELELERRSLQRKHEKCVPDSVIYRMKAHYSIPKEGDRLFDQIDFIELKREDVNDLVKYFNEEGKAMSGNDDSDDSLKSDSNREQGDQMGSQNSSFDDGNFVQKKRTLADRIESSQFDPYEKQDGQPTPQLLRTGWSGFDDKEHDVIFLDPQLSNRLETRDTRATAGSWQSAWKGKKGEQGLIACESLDLPYGKLDVQDIDRGRDGDRDRDSDRDRNRGSDKNVDRDRERDQDPNWDRNRGSDKNVDRDRERDQDPNWDRNRGSDKNVDRDRERDQDPNWDRNRGSDKNVDRDRERDQDPNWDRSSEYNRSNNDKTYNSRDHMHHDVGYGGTDLTRADGGYGNYDYTRPYGEYSGYYATNPDGGYWSYHPHPYGVYSGYDASHYGGYWTYHTRPYGVYSGYDAAHHDGGNWTYHTRPYEEYSDYDATHHNGGYWSYYSHPYREYSGYDHTHQIGAYNCDSAAPFWNNQSYGSGSFAARQEEYPRCNLPGQSQSVFPDKIKQEVDVDDFSSNEKTYVYGISSHNSSASQPAGQPGPSANLKYKTFFIKEHNHLQAPAAENDSSQPMRSTSSTSNSRRVLPPYNGEDGFSNRSKDGQVSDSFDADRGPWNDPTHRPREVSWQGDDMEPRRPPRGSPHYGSFGGPRGPAGSLPHSFRNTIMWNQHHPQFRPQVPPRPYFSGPPVRPRGPSHYGSFGYPRGPAGGLPHSFLDPILWNQYHPQLGPQGPPRPYFSGPPGRPREPPHYGSFGGPRGPVGGPPHGFSQ